MKRWAILTACLYALLVVLIVFPLCVAAFPLGVLEDIGDVGDLFEEVVSSFEYWAAALGVLGLVQFLYLIVPLRVARERPVGRRHWVFLAASSGFLFGLLIIGAACVLVEDLLAEPLPDGVVLNCILGVAGVSWLVWGIVFYGLGRRSAAPLRTVHTASDTLMKGSILEILVAVPSHVLARHRDYCCAGFGTFVGLAAGLATMLFAYGPGVFFLFAQRWGRLTRRPDSLPVRPRLKRHGGDALAWLVFAGGFLVICCIPLAVSGVIDRPVLGIERMQFGLGLIGFSVMCAVAIIHVVLAWIHRESRRKLTLVIGILALEFLVWMIWMWPVAVKVIEGD